MNPFLGGKFLCSTEWLRISFSSPMSNQDLCRTKSLFLTGVGQDTGWKSFLGWFWCDSVGEILTRVVSDVVVWIQVSDFDGGYHVFVPFFPVVRIVKHVENGRWQYFVEYSVHFYHFEACVACSFGPYLLTQRCITNSKKKIVSDKKRQESCWC